MCSKKIIVFMIALMLLAGTGARAVNTESPGLGIAELNAKIALLQKQLLDMQAKLAAAKTDVPQTSRLTCAEACKKINYSAGTCRTWALGNPADTYCTDMGYKVETRTGADGGQSSVCVFGDGKECDTWKFYRKECGTEYVKTDYASSIGCAKGEKRLGIGSDCELPAGSAGKGVGCCCSGKIEEPCAKEGEKIFADGKLGRRKCCAGLSIKPTTDLTGGKCLKAQDGSTGVCSKDWNKTCGDGTCAANEDKCNCARDCYDSRTCTQACLDKGYISGYCNTWTVTPDIKNASCKTGFVRFGWTSDCNMFENGVALSGAGKACCCEKKIPVREICKRKLSASPSEEEKKACELAQGKIECGGDHCLCVCPEANCKKEGETIDRSKQEKCCSGMNAIDGNKVVDDSGECAALKCGSENNASNAKCSASPVCAYCGNGICGTGENKCNCPKDCKDEGKYACDTDDDCKATCAYGCVSASWAAGKKDCESVPDFTCSCVYGKCAKKLLNKCKKEGEMCGGIAAFRCCDGLVCKLDGDYPDAGGKCVKKESCPEPRTANSGEACTGRSVYAKNPQTGECCEYKSSCNAPADWKSYSSRRLCEKNSTNECPVIAEPPADFCKDGTVSKKKDGKGCVIAYECKMQGTCPAPLESTGLCVNVRVWAKNPETGECCAYSTPCQVPKDWKVFYSSGECEKGEYKCIGEGQLIGYAVSPDGSNEWERTGKYLACCDGLEKIDYTARPDGEGNCRTVVGWTGSICAKCGNGICGKGENKCNCPKDCPAKEKFECVTAADCRATCAYGCVNSEWMQAMPDCKSMVTFQCTCKDKKCEKTSSEDAGTCDSICKGRQYASGYCSTYSISPEGYKSMCSGGGTRYPVPAADCKVSAGIIGVGKTCCCVSNNTSSR